MPPRVLQLQQQRDTGINDFTTDEFAAAFGFGLIMLCCCILAVRKFDIMKLIADAKKQAEQRARAMSQKVYAVGAATTASKHAEGP